MMTIALKFIRRPFVRNVGTLASGVAAAQVLATIFSPLLTRLYGPEAFGVLGVFNSILAVAAPVACLTYPVAIVLPKQNSVALQLARISVFLAFTSSAMATVIIFIWGSALAAALQAETIAPYLWFVPIAMCAGGILQVAQQWMLRRQAFQLTAYVLIIQAGATNLLKVVLGLIWPFSSTLIAVATFDAALETFLLVASRIRASTLWKSFGPRAWGGEIKIAKEYSDFPFFRAPQGLINAIGLGIPVLAISATFGPISTGNYILAASVLAVPTRLIGKSVADVFYPRIVRSFQNSENGALHLARATAALSVIGFLPFFLVVLIGPWMFSFVFGDAWRVAGDFARWLAIAQFFFFIARPAVVTVPAVGAQKMLLIFELVAVVARIGIVLFAVVFFDDPLPTIISLSTVNVLLYCYLIYITHAKARMWGRPK